MNPFDAIIEYLTWLLNALSEIAEFVALTLGLN